MSKQNASASIVQAYKSIRDNIISSAGASKVIAVSSPAFGEGKTTTAINLAVAFSKLGKKTLIIDADMRSGSVERKLHISSVYGLSDLLCGRAGLDMALVAKDAFVDVLPSGARHQNPEELLSSESFENLISGLRLAYDYIIIDSPSVCEFNDTLYTAKQSDGVVLVITEGKTKYKELDSAIELLSASNIKLLGTVINASKE